MNLEVEVQIIQLFGAKWSFGKIPHVKDRILSAPRVHERPNRHHLARVSKPLHFLGSWSIMQGGSNDWFSEYSWIIDMHHVILGHDTDELSIMIPFQAARIILQIVVHFGLFVLNIPNFDSQIFTCGRKREIGLGVPLCQLNRFSMRIQNCVMRVFYHIVLEAIFWNHPDFQW
jgi:hypothetical protein